VTNGIFIVPSLSVQDSVFWKHTVPTIFNRKLLDSKLYLPFLSRQHVMQYNPYLLPKATRLENTVWMCFNLWWWKSGTPT
jgi:hypothetical protein